MGAAGGVERFEDLHDLPVRLLQGPSVDSARLWSKTSSEAPEGPLVSDRHDRPTTPAEKGDQLSAERELTCPPTGILGCPRSLGVTQSMGAVGTSADHALAESFNATLKREVLQDAKTWPDEVTCRRQVFRWLVR